MTFRTLLIGAGLGGLVMYYFDQDRGNRRRALVRDQLIHVGKRGEAALEQLAKRIEYRQGQLSGLAHELRAEKGNVGDEVLVERVRAELGRATAHPRAIVVSANQGIVTVSGPILAREVDNMLHTIEGVRGVKHVENQLDVHEQPGDIPALQD